jgi:CheY-like chemotaxis protein
MVTEAETKTPASPYDAILMDYMMPGIDGIETFKLLRNTIKDFDTPVIAIAARAAADAEKLFLDEGFAAYLSKPVLPDHLDEALLRVLPQGRVQIKTAEEQGRTALKPRTLSCEDLIAAMADRGIFLDKGLRYFSLHAAQFRKTLVMFLENYPKRQEEMRLLFDKRDWAALKFRAHSLKSSARAIGAEELSGTAAKLEKYCAAGKAAGRDRLIEATAGLLFPEWEETERGIRLFIDETEAGEDGSAEPGLPADSGKADLIEKLLNHLRGMNLGAAKKEITALLSVTDQKERLVFTGIREQIQELEYGKAEKLLLEYIKKNPVVFGA